VEEQPNTLQSQIPETPLKQSDSNENTYQEQAIPEQIPVTNTSPSPNNFLKKSLLIPLIVLLVLFTLGVTFWVLSTKKENLTNQNNTNKKTSIIVKPKTNHVALYTTMDGEDILSSSYSIHIFDFDTKTEIELPNNLNVKPNHRVYFGVWSPDGRYLPIQIDPQDKKCTDCKIETYFYDAHDNTAKLVYSADYKTGVYSGEYTDLKETEKWAYYTTMHGYKEWLDNSTVFASLYTEYSNSITLNDKGVISIIAPPIEGTIREETSHKNQDFKYQNVLSDDGQKIISKKFTVNNKTYEYPIMDEQIVGITDNKLITFNKPEQKIYIGFCDYGCDEMMTYMQSIQERNLDFASQEVFDEINDQDKDVINFYNLENGQLEKSINISSKDWTTISATFVNNKIIIHQTNRSLNPTTERFLVSNNLSEFTPLLENKIDFLHNSYTSDIPYASLYQSDFLMSPDNEDILYSKISSDYIDKDPTYNMFVHYDVFAKSITAGKEYKICEKCNDFRVYNPWLMSTYNYNK